MNSFARTQTSRRTAARLAGGAAVFALALGCSGGLAAAATSAHHKAANAPHWVVRHDGHRAVLGTVTAVAAGGFTLQRGVTTIAVSVGANTTYHERGVDNASLANVAVGDRVVVAGTAQPAGGGIAARRVAIVSSTTRTLEGTVTSLTTAVSTSTGASASTGSFTMTHGIGTVQVAVAATTVFTETGLTGVTFATLQSGDHVRVTGTVANGTFTAATVAIAAPHLYSVVGTVSATAAGGFTLAVGDHHSVSVAVSAATKYLATAVASPSLASAAIGATVVAVGTRAGGGERTGGINATTVVILG